MLQSIEQSTGITERDEEIDILRSENLYLRELLTKVGEKDEATDALLFEIKADREVLGQTLDRATNDLQVLRLQLESSQAEEERLGR